MKTKQNGKIKISASYTQVDTKTVDAKHRITVGEPLAPGYRVQIYKNEDDGTVLLVPCVEIPAREAWLYKNPKALKSVLQGIKDAEEGRLHKLNLKTMKVE